jgi:hypothetical protein
MPVPAVLSDGVVVTLPKRTGSVLGGDVGGVAGAWPDGVAMPPGFPAAVGEPACCPGSGRPNAVTSPTLHRLIECG